MGIDISGVFQARSGDRWIHVGEYSDSMRGTLRSWLAPWKSAEMEPIAPWRGLPADLQELQRQQPTDQFANEECCSWVSADEILEALPLFKRWTQTVSEEEFQKAVSKENWDYTHAPFVEHPPKFVAANRRPGQSGDDHKKFEAEFVVDVSDEVKKFTDKVLELKNAHGEVRFVFEYG